MSHEIEDERNIDTAEQNWDSGLEFGHNSNFYALVKALLESAERVDNNLEEIYYSQHINDATDGDLDKFGELVQVYRKRKGDFGKNFGTSFGSSSLEDDDPYRARIKAAFRVGNIGTTADQFIEFAATLLQTDVQNVRIEYPNNRTVEPAQINFYADPSVYNNVGLTDVEVEDLLNDAVPAGHEVNGLESGTFILKQDFEIDDPDEGLTSDSIQTGGTLAEDLVS